ncbi:MAG: ATP-binding protein [Eubacteriales bacterium]|nr:ATP-binding protein [Eubacteriales bacterium]
MSISDVLAEYDRIQRQNETEKNRRRRQAYKKVPELKEIHEKVKTLQIERLKQSISGHSGDKDEILALQEKAITLLTDAGFDQHYLDPVYTCPACRDTGVIDGAQRCGCFKKRVLEDKLDAARLTDSSVSFEQFNIDIFDDKPIEKGKSQKDQMVSYKQVAEAYANKFPDCLPVLLLSGGIGLGKTYIAKCIMRRVIERGNTAAYYTAYRLFSLFHRHRLGENIDLDPIFEVPLLIIDDIGTEPMTRNVTVEYFFDLINERSGLHTIIVTNLPFEEINARYGERIHSRLMDTRHSQKIIFRGKDIRY